MLVCCQQSCTSECLLRVLCFVPIYQKRLLNNSIYVLCFLIPWGHLTLSVHIELTIVAEVLKSSKEFVCLVVSVKIETSHIKSIVSMAYADNVMLRFGSARRTLSLTGLLIS